MHELVPTIKCYKIVLYSFIFSILMQKQFLQVTEKDPFYLSDIQPCNHKLR